MSEGTTLVNEEVVVEGELNKYMTFLCDGDYYGFGISHVTEITAMQPITEVPETEHFIKGLINLRGKIIPVIDVRARLGKDLAEYNDRTCIIVATVGEEMIGLIVDEIAEVVSLAPKDIVDPPSTDLGSQNNRFLSGIGKVGSQVKLLLDLNNLLYYGYYE